MVIKHVVSQPDPPFAYHIWFENTRIAMVKMLGSRLHNWPMLTNERCHAGYVPFLYDLWARIDLWETCDKQAGGRDIAVDCGEVAPSAPNLLKIS